MRYFRMIAAACLIVHCDAFVVVSRSKARIGALRSLHAGILPSSDELQNAVDDGTVVELTAAVWSEVCAQAATVSDSSPLLTPYLERTIGRHTSLPEALAGVLSDKIADDALGLSNSGLAEELAQLLSAPRECAAMTSDLLAVAESDPASPQLLSVLLHFKGFLALQTQRAAHALWALGPGDAGARELALLLQGRTSALWGVDIHPGATIGAGVFLDHASGIVVGEQATLGDGCYVLHGVTLGSTGKRDRETGRRHPLVGARVTLGSGATLLGPIIVGDGAVIGTGATVTKDVAPGATVIDTNPLKNRVLLPRKPKESP